MAETDSFLTMNPFNAFVITLAPNLQLMLSKYNIRYVQWNEMEWRMKWKLDWEDF